MSRRPKKWALEKAFDRGYRSGGSYSRRGSSSSAAGLGGCLTVIILPVVLIFGPIFLGLEDSALLPCGVALAFLIFIFVGVLFIRYKRKADLERLNQKNEAENARNLELIKYRQFVDVDPERFEHAIGALFQKHGFQVMHKGSTGDGGVDLKMTKDGMKFIVQCKRYTNAAVGEPALREFYGALINHGASHGYFVTTSRFTQPAVDFARNKPITLVDEQILRKWIAGEKLS